jgi:membrane-associated phospholipid phosphatase
VIDASSLRVNELIGLGYFAYLAFVALIVRIPFRRRVRVWATGLVSGALIVSAAYHPTPIGSLVREWLPPLVILIGYFVTGQFFVAPSGKAEEWLKRWDEALIGPTTFERLPAVLRLYLDVVYDACFLMIPAGFAVLLWGGGSSHADHFWTLVLAAEFLAFGTLPWFQARPPWAIETRRAIDATAVRRFSLFWVNHTSIRANTFPSGHASASMAVAFGLAPVVPWAAIVFGILAISIAAGSVVGRFHYAIDAVAGLLLAVVVWGAAAWIGV